MAKGVLGNDPFQRGAAQRPSEPKPAQGAGQKAAAPKEKPAEKPTARATPKPPEGAKKATRPAEAPAAKKAAKPAEAPAAKKAAKPHETPAAKPAEAPAAKKAAKPHEAPAAKKATKPAEAPAAKKAAKPHEAPAAKAATPKEQAPAPVPAAPLPIEAVIAAGAEVEAQVTPPAPEPAPASIQDLMALREPAAPEPPSPEAQDLTELEEKAVAAADALQELEETLGDSLPMGPVTVPGFEDAVDVAETLVEVLDASQDEYPPGSEAEAEAEARIEVEVETALAPAAPVTSHGDVFFTSESEGAEPHRLGDRLVGLLSLAKDVAFQALASERFGKTMGSVQGLVGAALTGIGVGGGTAIDEYGKDVALGGVLQPVMDFLYERYWRVSVQGASHVPAGPVLLVANHSGALPFDGPMLQLALSRERPDLQEARWLAEDQVFHAPMLGTLMNRLGAVRACPENALRLLNELRPVIVFPEGIQGLGKPFAQRYQLKRFGRGGFVKLALRTGAPIVPVAIVGAEETAPLFGKIPARFLGIPYLPVTPPPLPARWTIRFGDPISMGELPPEAADDLSQVQRLTERTRESIQGMLQALLKERRSVFAG